MHLVKLIIAYLYTNETDFQSILDHCESIWGESDFISEVYSFNMTSYYENEMGPNLNRRFVSFYTLVSANSLAEIKIQSNLLEKKYSLNDNRKINIDPGYLDMDKLILASMKYGRQKIYLGKDVWADPVLHYYKKHFQHFDWTFPDFKDHIYDEELMNIRQLYKKEVRNRILDKG